MNPDNVVFTTDENVDCIKHGDQCVELLGIITQIEAPKLVGQGDKKHKLMKFIVYNNGNRNVQCLIWNNLIYSYENKIKANEIIHIDGGTVKASSNLYKRSDVNLAPIEISIQDFTNVHFYGPYENEAADDEPIEISFSEIPNNTGRIKVRGYMKTIFQFMGKASDAARGTMCNETHKIMVRISNYTEIANLEKGSLIEVVGTIQYIDDAITILCSSSDDITLTIEDKMNIAQLVNINKTFIRSVLPSVNDN